MNTSKASDAPNPAIPGEALGLHISGEDCTPRVQLVNGSRAVLGRAPDALVRLDHDTVSRHHAEIVKDPFGRWWVRDLVSRNGTKLNGQRINEHLLGNGDVLRVGKFTVRVELVEALEATLAPAPSLPVPPLDDALDIETSTMDELTVPKIAVAQLTTLADFGQRLNEMDDPTERMKQLCALMVTEEFHGMGAMILKLNKATPALEPQVLAAVASNRPGYLPVPLSRTVLETVANKSRPVLAGNTRNETREVNLSISPDIMPLAALACPIRLEADRVVVLYVGLPPEYGLPEWLALASLAVKEYQQAESIWASRQVIRKHAAIEHDLQQAQAIQQRLIPTKVQAKGMDLALNFQPCRWVGGDYADIVPLSNDRIFLGVADVCGKGLQAALVSSSLHTLVRASLRGGMSLPDVMCAANEHLCEYLPSGAFVTMVAAIIDVQTGKVECINAGHPQLLVVSDTGELRELDLRGSIPLGIDPAPLCSQEIELPRQHLMVMYTDGWTDLSDGAGQQLGLEQLGQAVQSSYRKHAKASLSDFLERLTAQLDGHRGNCLPADDRTLLVARRQ